jgi:hypothetical protein
LFNFLTLNLKFMKIAKAIQSMSLNELDALLQTSVSAEFQSAISGHAGLHYEGYEGVVSLERLVNRIRTAFNEVVEPFKCKAEKEVQSLTSAERSLYKSRIDLGSALINKADALYRKIAAKEAHHLWRKTCNIVDESQQKVAQFVSKKFKQKTVPPQEKTEKWRQEVQLMEADLAAHAKTHAEALKHFAEQEAQRKRTEEAREAEASKKQNSSSASNGTSGFESGQFDGDEDDELLDILHRIFSNSVSGRPKPNTSRAYTFKDNGPGYTYYFYQSSNPFAGHFAGQQTQASAASDPYRVLQVTREASSEEIKKAYHKLARVCHPDKNQDDPKAKEKFQVLERAYAVLKDPQKKAEYDAFGIVRQGG